MSVAPTADLDELLRGRLRSGLAGTVLSNRQATIVLDAADSGVWTIELADGRGRARRGAAGRAELRIASSTAVLAGIAAGRTSGVQAFLDGRLTVRGDLALALALDGLFDAHPDRDPHLPRALEVEAMGVRTRYLEAGPPGAPPVVLLHGLGATNASMLPVLADLAADHRVLAPDLPGFGASDAPAAPYNAAWFAAWTEGFQRATDSRPAVLVGNSLGGRVSLECGLTHPSSVRAVVLLTPSPAFRRLRQYVPLVRMVTPRVARLPVVTSHRMAVEGIRMLFSEPDRLPASWYDAAADESLRVLADPRHRVALFAAARQIYLEDAYGRNGFWQRLPGLEPPALFVWGDRDRLVPFSFARHVSSALPLAGSVVLEDCGHVPQFEQPQDTMAMIRGFLEEVELAELRTGAAGAGRPAAPRRASGSHAG